jgi:SAM-dependent methyltransferase
MNYFTNRFTYSSEREKAWKYLTHYLQKKFIANDSVILELGAGYCSFINHVSASKKIAIDIEPDFVNYAGSDIQTRVGSVTDLEWVKSNYVDVVFASNLLEHLYSQDLLILFPEIFRILKPGGKFIVMQPNYRYAYREYFDDYTHRSIFSHISLRDSLLNYGYEVIYIKKKFMPLTLKSRLSKLSFIIPVYLRLPYRFKAQQMLLVSVKPF